ncbi:DUF5807 family protein [Halobaculum sp. MBLA0143]|uniref:DUF5807 family protein n=1 Tax=Halobaculum sp. MBLA0143 TaxID=3079933 RepID=UPI003524B790
MDESTGEGGALASFLAGERLEDVAIFLADEYTDAEGRLAEIGDEVDGGVVLVVPGEKGRRAFASGTGMDAMEFAQTAMNVDGEISPGLDGGECPEAGDDDRHAVEFIFAFAEAENEGVGGLYAEGDVVHAYAHCACGTSYSHKWVVGDRVQ